MAAKTGSVALGVLGVGHLAGAMLAGLRRSGLPAGDVLLSPRGHGPALAAAHGHALATDNADLVTRARIVLLAVRPHHAAAALEGLPWQEDHLIVSACAGVPIAVLARAAAPARIQRVMPMTAAEIGASPTACHPDLPETRALLNRLGPVIPLPHEQDFEVATVSAAAYGWVQTLIGRTIGWSVAQGLDPAAARALVAQTFAGAGALIAARPEPVAQLLDELVTPGGITERGLQVLDTGGFAPLWDDACDAVLAKLAATRTGAGGG